MFNFICSKNSGDTEYTITQLAYPAVATDADWNALNKEEQAQTMNPAAVADIVKAVAPDAVEVKYVATADIAQYRAKPTADDFIEAIRAQVDAMAAKQMTALATAWGYDNIYNVMARRGSSNAQMNADAIAAQDYDAALWDLLISQQTSLLDSFKSGAVALPATLADVPTWCAAHITLPALTARPVVDAAMVDATEIPKL
jgi:hypothetical protein